MLRFDFYTHETEIIFFFFFNVCVFSPSFLSQYWYMGSWPPLEEGPVCVCVRVCMCTCVVIAQWEVDEECFWLDNWFAPVFTFNLWWAWPVEGSQSGTVGLNQKRLDGLSKSHRKLCHSFRDFYWGFPHFFKRFGDTGCHRNVSNTTSLYYQVMTHHLHLEE